MKEYGEEYVSDDTESNFSTLKGVKPRNSCPNPVGHERMKRSSKTRMVFTFEDTICPRLYYKDILVYEDDLCLQTSTYMYLYCFNNNICLILHNATLPKIYSYGIRC